MISLDASGWSSPDAHRRMWRFAAGGVRRGIKTGSAMALHGTRMERVLAGRKGLLGAPLIVGYHRIVENFQDSARQSIAPLLTSARMFELQLDWIGKHYDFVSLDDMQTILDGTQVPPRPVAAVTFDDGYRDVFDIALPILTRKGIPATVFVVTDFTGSDHLHAHDEVYLLFSRLQAIHGDPRAWMLGHETLPESIMARLLPRLGAMRTPFDATRAVLEVLEQADIQRLLKCLSPVAGLSAEAREEFSLLDWDMLRTMIANDVSVGSHTKSHALLSEASERVLKAELRESRRILEENLGVPVRHLAYPDGRFDDAAVDAAADAGYRTAYTICRHRSSRHPLLTIPRTMLWEKACVGSLGYFSGSLLSCQIHGIFDPAARCKQTHRTSESPMDTASEPC